MPQPQQCLSQQQSSHRTIMAFLLPDGDEIARRVPAGQLSAEVGQATVEVAKVGDPSGELLPLRVDRCAQLLGYLIAATGSAHGRQRRGLFERKVELP